MKHILNYYKNIACCLLYVGFACVVTAQAPTITSFSPVSGAIGSSVTITGTGFNTTAANNIVFFGATKAVVTAASATSLTVTVPLGATYQDISVTNLGVNLTAYSQEPFDVTFNGSIDFAAPAIHQVGDEITSISIADMDGDGKSDLVVANSGGVSILRNTSTLGNISFATQISFSAPEYGGVSIADIDGDGKPDIIMNTDNGIDSIFILRNTSSVGSVNFSNYVSFPITFFSSEYFKIAVNDMDGDGKPDLIFIRDYDTTGNLPIAILRNVSTSGHINFLAPSIFSSGLPAAESIVVGDLDGDGKADLAITSVYSGDTSLSILRNVSSIGNINFSLPVILNASSVISSALGDINNDGRPDLVILSSDSIIVFVNNSTSGNIIFASETIYVSGTNAPISVAISDIDGDGSQDIIIYYNLNSPNGQDIYIFRNVTVNGSIAFAPPIIFTNPTHYSNGINIADIDGDGKPDICSFNSIPISAYNYFDSIFVMRQISSPIITTGTVSTSICAPATLSVPYTVSSSFASNNQFVAQLSNPTGSFTNPTTIGSISSTTSGTISATINAGIPAGTGYLIRVISDNQSVIGTTNGSNIQVNQKPALTLGYGISIDTPICPNSSATITLVSSSLATGTYLVTYNLSGATTATGNTATLNYVVGFQGLNNTAGIGSFTTPTLNSGSTVISFTSMAFASSPTCTYPMNYSVTIATTAIIPPSVSIAITSGSQTTCSDSNVTFAATPYHCGTSPSYNWLVSGNSVQSGSSATYSTTALTNNSAVQCIITSSLICANPTTATSNSITISVPGPPAFSITSTTSACGGGSSLVTISSSALPSGIYSVTYNLGLANSATNQTATINFFSGNGTFTTQALQNAGTTSLNIIYIQGSTICPGSVNVTGSITVYSPPDISNLIISSSPVCSLNGSSTITLKSTTLTTGTYTVTYDLTGADTALGHTAQMNFTGGNPGTGTFTTSAFSKIGISTLALISIAPSSSPGCLSYVGNGNIYSKALLHIFPVIAFGGGTDGGIPIGSITNALNGMLYGVSFSGGINADGTVFQVNPATNVYSKVYDFTSAGIGAIQPNSALLQASNGSLYGISYSGGASQRGALYQFNPTSNTANTVVSFNGTNGAVNRNGIYSGISPAGALIQASTGILYGTTPYGGTNNEGVIFSFDPTTSSLTTLYSFDSVNSGAHPNTALVQATANGYLYGVTPQGGSANDGVIFQFNPVTNAFTKVLDMISGSGIQPSGALVQANNGNLYGMTALGGGNAYGILYELNPSSNAYTKLLDFNGTTGGQPVGALMKASNGLLYGVNTTYNNGINAGTGFLFQFNPANNAYDTLLSFNAPIYSSPSGMLAQSPNGLLYGYANTFTGIGSGLLYAAYPFDTTNITCTAVNIPHITILDSACASLPAILGAVYNPDTAITAYNWSNGDTGQVISTSQTGTYTVQVATNGCVSASSPAVGFPQISGCGGRLVFQSDTQVNFFDTVHVNVLVEDGSNLFSIFAKLSFDKNYLRLISSTVGNFLGSNIINTPPVVTGDTIEFGMTKTHGQSGSNGNGLVYSFDFVLNKLPVFGTVHNPTDTITSNDSIVAFNATDPTGAYTIFRLSTPTINTATGSVVDVGMPGPDTVGLTYYVPVWPGDLNNDHVVNVADILPIGYFYNDRGTSRPDGSLQWVAQPAPLWGADKTNQNSISYETFADGNADGVIDLADQNSIGFNLGNYHALPPASNTQSSLTARSTMPALQAYTAETQIDSGQLPYMLNVSVNVGSPYLTVDSLLGIAFDLYYDAECIDTAALVPGAVTFSNKFGSYPNDFTHIEDFTDKGNGRISIGVTRLANTPLNLSGDAIVTVQFKLVNGCYDGWFHIAPNFLAANDAYGTGIQLQPVADSVRVVAAQPAAINRVPVQKIKIYPNPANMSITIANINLGLNYSIEIINSVDQVVYMAPLDQSNINISTLASGVYYVIIKNDLEFDAQKLVIAR